jgi:hypothetical protein
LATANYHRALGLDAGLSQGRIAIIAQEANMTIPSEAFRSYPSVCKNVVWQKFKSFKDKAKAKTKTGLGDTLKEAEKAWAKIVWKDLDAKKLKATTLPVARANQVKAQAAMVNVTNAKHAVTIAHAKAIETMGNTALSKPAKDQAEVIRNGLKYALTNLDKVNINDFQEEITRLGG